MILSVMKNTSTQKEQLIKRLEEAVCCFEHPEQECLEEVEAVVAWFDVDDEERKEVINYFKDEYSDYKWVSKMIRDVFSYVSFRPELVS